MDDNANNDSPSAKRTGTGWLATTMSVLAAGFGVQTQAALERDFKKGSVFQFVVAGLLGTLGFIVMVYLMVQWVMSTA